MNKLPTLSDCQDFLDGSGPRNSLHQALLSKMTAASLRELARQEAANARAYIDAKAQAQDFDRLERESRAAKKARETSLEATKQAFRKQSAERIAIERKAASKKASPAASASRRPVAKPLPKSPITRAEFAKLTPAERMAHIKTGGKLI
jgi:hypothetical protein